MTSNSYFQILFYVVTLIALAKPLGWYMARVYEGESVGLNRLLAPVERLIYRLSGVNPEEEMRWTDYAIGFLVFNLLGALAVFALQRLQASLPFNPQNLPGVSPDSSFNTAASFATNTNWQGYSGEVTDELSDPDAGADGAELCLRRSGHGDAGRIDSRIYPAQCRYHRQFLGRPYPQHAVHPDAAIADSGFGTGRTRRGADFQSLSNGTAR